MTLLIDDTIAAVATPAGRGGVGIVRISGPDVDKIAATILGKVPVPRVATYAAFNNGQKESIDVGLALYFPKPHSFTGEDVLELQGHGGPVVLNLLLQSVLSAGARLAEPGEFSKRAFLNDKLDLNQAEAIADLIDAGSVAAARGAMRSLQGEFSARIQTINQTLIESRMFIEAAIDFPEEEIDFISESRVVDKVKQVLDDLEQLLRSAKQGVLLQEGMTAVIVGKPNAGKSSLLNSLSGRDSAIVTDIPGTTRDILREKINIGGMPLHIIDTAGLRDTEDHIEQEGIRRAQAALFDADVVLCIIDSTDASNDLPLLPEGIEVPIVVINNKIDLLGVQPNTEQKAGKTWISISAKHQQGIDLLTAHLQHLMGFSPQAEGIFSARERHLQAILKAKGFLEHGLLLWKEHRAGELLAEDIKQAHQALGSITGEFTADDVLGEIFTRFCIGK